MKIELDLEYIKSRIESVLFDQRLITDEEHIEINSSNRYFNFWYGIAEVKETKNLYGFTVNIDTEDKPVVYRIFGDIKRTFGSKDIDSEKDEECYIYERLNPGDALILSKQEDTFIVAENEDGELHIKRKKLEEEEDNGNKC